MYLTSTLPCKFIKKLYTTLVLELYATCSFHTIIIHPIICNSHEVVYTSVMLSRDSEKMLYMYSARCNAFYVPFEAGRHRIQIFLMMAFSCIFHFLVSSRCYCQNQVVITNDQ